MQENSSLSKSFWFFISARFLALLAHQMLLVALGQYIYVLTHQTMPLAWMGLALFLPRALLVLVSGHVADRFPRKTVIIICRVASFVLSVFFLILYLGQIHNLIWWYLLLALLGTSYSFDGPANQAIVPDLVPVEKLNQAIAYNSTNMQLAFILGPALSGIIYALGDSPLPVLILILFCRLASALLMTRVHSSPVKNQPGEMTRETLVAGLKYVWEKKIILGTISLDLFAVLLGGAVALMPVFANDILHVGAWGLGVLRAAPCIGAVITAFYLANAKPMSNAGPAMFVSVFIFGVVTVLFGLSKNFTLSVSLLIVLGAADMVSVQIRHMLVQLMTPQEMRGRVGAVNLVFIGASNELGEFESGLAATLLGTVPAVVFGGIGTLAVVGLWTLFFPEIRQLKRLQNI